MDIDKIEPGVDFTSAIANSLECCDVMLAIIGPRWLGARNQAGSRIKDEDDWVRLEIATALNRNIRVVPVLVDGGDLPGEDELPADLQPLLKRQAYEISNKRWQYDTEKLIQFLENAIGVIPKRNPSPLPQKKATLTGAFKWVLIIAGGIFILSIVLFAIGVLPDETSGDVYDNIVYDSTKPGGSENFPVDNRNEKPTTQTESVVNVDGIWNDGNGLYYLDIIQEGNKLDITSHALNGQETGSGEGTVKNRQLSADINVYNVGQITLNGSLQANKKLITGTTTISANGSSFTEPLQLIKND
jgi:hypothetical protein